MKYNFELLSDPLSSQLYRALHHPLYVLGLCEESKNDILKEISKQSIKGHKDTYKCCIQIASIVKSSTNQRSTCMMINIVSLVFSLYCTISPTGYALIFLEFCSQLKSLHFSDGSTSWLQYHRSYLAFSLYTGSDNFHPSSWKKIIIKSKDFFK